MFEMFRGVGQAFLEGVRESALESLSKKDEQKPQASPSSAEIGASSMGLSVYGHQMYMSGASWAQAAAAGPPPIIRR